ncbi:MAG TPA: hypothetical protein ENJ91_10770 [Rhodobacteraceae bacterium]|nr:hypothetical protein [Paracoccaceae bacterium]
MGNDSVSRNHFLSGHPQHLQVPNAVIQEYWRRADGKYPGGGADAHKRPSKIGAALKQLPARIYKYRRGYSFSWGQVTERRRSNLVLWEIVYVRLLRQLHWHKLGLPEIQRAAFEYLLANESRFQADPWRALDIPGRFIITPGTVYDAWCVVCHFSAESDGRRWLYQALRAGGRVRQVAQWIEHCYLAT